MRKTNIAKAILAASAISFAAAPIAAEAQTKRRVLECSNKEVRRSANTGTVIGAVGGGLVGNVVTKDTAGTLVGAGVGAVAGHEIAKKRAKKKCRYVYR